MRTTLTLILLTVLSAQSGFGASDLKCVDLRCEFLTNPVGIDRPAPRFTWRLESNTRGQKQLAYRILVASSQEKLAADEGDLWDSGKVEDRGLIYHEYGWTAPQPGKQPPAAPAAPQAKPLQSGQAVTWKVKVWDKDQVESEWSEPAQFTMALLKNTDWTAEWISFRDASRIPTNPNSLHLPPPHYYRKPFELKKTVKRALAYSSALGIYELHLNGSKVGDAYLAPGWSDYHQRAYYNTHDVTSQLQQGKNCLGAVVADGWYAGYVGPAKGSKIGPNRLGRNLYGKNPALLVQLHIEYEDGSTESLVTDPSWQVATGPESEADLLMGESYDARKEIPGWDTADFAASGWKQAVLAASNPKTRAMVIDKAGRKSTQIGFTKPPLLNAYPAELVRITQELPAVEITSPKTKSWIFDFGQNFTGNVRLKVVGAKGQKLTLRYGELLHPDGRLFTDNLRQARATDTYICKGDPDGESWTPRFTIHGFRYAEVSGLEKKPALDALTGLVIHSDLSPTSGFECSDPVVSKIYQNSVWTYRGNVVDIPTNSPQRDDRMGAARDVQIGIRAASYHFDGRAFFGKWIEALQTARDKNGFYPRYAPYPFADHKFAYSTAWSDAGIIAPYVLWWMSGDHDLIKPRWFAMSGFMDARRSLDPKFSGIKFGAPITDEGHLDDPTPPEFIDLCYQALNCRFMMEMSRVSIGPVGYVKFRNAFGKILSTFNGQYLNEDGSLKVKSQTAHVLALRFGLVPAEHKEKVAQDLLALIKAKTSPTHSGMTTGLLGTKPLLPVLSWTGNHDEAVRLLQSRKFPSWGYQVENGATTIWERSDAFTKEHGFKGLDGKHNPSDSSFSHPASAAVSEWMMAMLAGIENMNSGFKTIRLEPRIPSANATDETDPINWVKAHYDCTHGRIAVHWKRVGESGLLYEATVPPNTQAALKLPVPEGSTVTEGGKPPEEAEGVSEDTSKDRKDHRVFILESGSYRFEVK